ncbi:unnamed protein product [Echinostoma caproni]|uniref:C2H2-type domain-containing protein n=1 Tax=Echinostoma caproni TaxID=27848 RepID=A0A183AIR6_9TREM|nr:unnamed protein product [Echinostoma caproni]
MFPKTAASEFTIPQSSLDILHTTPNQADYSGKEIICACPEFHSPWPTLPTLAPMSVNALFWTYHTLLQSRIDKDWYSFRPKASSPVTKTESRRQTTVPSTVSTTTPASFWSHKVHIMGRERKTATQTECQKGSDETIRSLPTYSKWTEKRNTMSYLAVKAARGRVSSQSIHSQSSGATAFERIVPTARVLARMARIPNLIGPYVCRLCEEEFGDPFKLAAHRCPYILHTDYRCPDCEKVSSQLAVRIYRVHSCAR